MKYGGQGAGQYIDLWQSKVLVTGREVQLLCTVSLSREHDGKLAILLRMII